MKKTSRNGKIELLRFYFSIAVLLFHINKYFLKDTSMKGPLHLSLFPHGAMGVEFFFLLSGCLMAASVYSHPSNSAVPLGQETGSFLWRKIRAILPYHLIAFPVTALAYLWYAGFGLKKSLLFLINSVPAFFLLNMIGIPSASPNHVEWYLSVMLFSMLLLYPLLRRNYSLFVYVIAPALALVLLSYLAQTYHSLTGVAVWMGFCYKGTVRGFAELALGATAFEAARRLSGCRLTQGQRGLLSAVELGAFGAVAVFLLFTFQPKYEIFSVFAIFVLIVLAFSGQTWGHERFNNKFCLFLGKLSLPIYLSQVTAVNLTKTAAKALPPERQAFLCFAMTAVLSVLLMLTGDWLKRRLFPPKAA